MPFFVDRFTRENVRSCTSERSRELRVPSENDRKSLRNLHRRLTIFARRSKGTEIYRLVVKRAVASFLRPNQLVFVAKSSGRTIAIKTGRTCPCCGRAKRGLLHNYPTRFAGCVLLVFAFAFAPFFPSSPLSSLLSRGKSSLGYVLFSSFIVPPLPSCSFC